MDKKIILARIDELMREKKISNYELKENAEISSTIYQWRKNASRDRERIPSLRSIEKICDYFGVSLAYFFSFSSEGQRTVRETELMNKMKNLTDEQLDLVDKLIGQFK